MASSRGLLGKTSIGVLPAPALSTRGGKQVPARLQSREYDSSDEDSDDNDEENDDDEDDDAEDKAPKSAAKLASAKDLEWTAEEQQNGNETPLALSFNTS